MAIPPGTVLGIVREAVAPTGAAHAWSMGQQHIVLDLRIPRAILATLVGAGLGLVGSVLQGITRNPLADPLPVRRVVRGGGGDSTRNVAAVLHPCC